VAVPAVKVNQKQYQPGTGGLNIVRVKNESR
jgi:hypothetical protein